MYQKRRAKEKVEISLHTVKVTTQNVQSYIEATGTIQPDIDGGAKIISPLPGAVEKIFVKIGNSVRKGTPLATIKSSDVSDSYSSHLSAQAQLTQAERLYNLNKQLFEIGTITKNDLLDQRVELSTGHGACRRVEEKARNIRDINRRRSARQVDNQGANRR